MLDARRCCCRQRQLYGCLAQQTDSNSRMHTEQHTLACTVSCDGPHVLCRSLAAIYVRGRITRRLDTLHGSTGNWLTHSDQASGFPRLTCSARVIRMKYKNFRRISKPHTLPTWLIKLWRAHLLQLRYGLRCVALRRLDLRAVSYGTISCPVRLHGWLRLRKENEGAAFTVHSARSTKQGVLCLRFHPLYFTPYTRTTGGSLWVWLKRKKAAACKRTKLIRIVSSCKITCLF